MKIRRWTFDVRRSVLYLSIAVAQEVQARSLSGGSPIKTDQLFNANGTNRRDYNAASLEVLKGLDPVRRRGFEVRARQEYVVPAASGP